MSSKARSLPVERHFSMHSGMVEMRPVSWRGARTRSASSICLRVSAIISFLDLSLDEVTDLLYLRRPALASTAVSEFRQNPVGVGILFSTA